MKNTWKVKYRKGLSIALVKPSPGKVFAAPFVFATVSGWKKPMESPTEPSSRTPPIDRNRELLKLAHEETFKVMGDENLHAYFWRPTTDKTGLMPLPVAAFFFSSGWDHGQISQFAPHAVYFASRGMVTVAFEYRVSSKHGTGPLEAIEDAADAFRWLRLNAEELNINPNQIVGVGGSGGAFAIAANALLSPPLKRNEVLPEVHPLPNAMVLFNPVLDTSKDGFGLERFPDPATAKKHNLIRAIRKQLPPTLIMHGTADRVIPFGGSYTYAKKTARKKNICRLIEFEGAGHGFFNFNVSFERYEATLVAMDDFFVTLGLLQPDPDSLLGDTSYTL
jgi:acetyl esterase/lipase